MNKLNLDLNGFFDITIMQEAFRIFNMHHFDEPPSEIKVFFNVDILKTDGKRLLEWVQSKPFVYWPLYNHYKEDTHKIYLEFPEQNSIFDTFVAVNSVWWNEPDRPNFFNHQVIRNEDIRGCS